LYTTQRLLWLVIR